MQPTPGDVHVDQLLSNVSTAYIQNPNSFIADKVFPIVPVTFKSDKIAQFTKQPWMRSQAKPRGLSSESAGSGYEVTTTTYACEVYALHKDIDDQTRKNSQSPFAPDKNATDFVTQQLLLQREIQFMTDFFATGKWGNEWTGNTSASDYAGDTIKQWDQSSGATPIADVINACTEVQLQTGMRPNIGVISRQVYDKLKVHSEILDRIKYTSSDSIDRILLARLFELEDLLIAEAVYDTAAEGAAASQSFVAGKHMLLAYRTPTPALDMPTAGLIPVWTDYLGAGGFGNRIKKFRMEPINSDRVEGELAYDMKVVCSDAAIFLNGVIA